jgi:recombinational DNA repair ATPase RecF
VFLDETALTRVSDLVAHFQTVHFAPQDVALVLQFSVQRRRLLDIVLSQADTDYLKALQTYQRLLTQRNHYLRSLGHRSIDTTETDVWDAKLARSGSYLRHRRLSGLVEMLPAFQRHYQMFSTGQEAAGLLYADAPLPPSNEHVPSEEQLEQEFRQQLSDAHEKERQRPMARRANKRASFCRGKWRNCSCWNDAEIGSHSSCSMTCFPSLIQSARHI